ncbi:disulfide bond formation protein DsbA [Sulfitobacter sp. HI0040]|nr:disulfide bond formation protein DsbA [Sulfitobacter sp. HI0023]KZY25516.1 disulfide bond formation protein DsbA [Sulfitobacter sp. HI0040]KZZ69489.1 disulfide bond formation protein DsbA [Sulfitobacter sp. HI0129]
MMHRLIAPLFAAATALALTLPAQAMDLTELTDAERAQFRAEVRSYLLDNPEVIMEAVELLQNREAEAQANAEQSLISDNADAIFNDGYSYVGGNPEGDITLVEFLDYKCGYCKRAHPEVEKLLKTDGNIKLIVKEFPILGAESMLASRYVVAAKQVVGGDSYKALGDALMAYNGEVTLPALRRLATTFGLDSDAIEAKMDSDEVTAEIAKTRALADRLRISGTPTFVLEDEMLRGYLPYDQMMALVEEKRG